MIGAELVPHMSICWSVSRVRRSVEPVRGRWVGADRSPAVGGSRHDGNCLVMPSLRDLPGENTTLDRGTNDEAGDIRGYRPLCHVVVIPVCRDRATTSCEPP
jgi:hypothetical protein